MNHKFWILKLIEGKNHINNSEKIYIQHYHFLYDAGLHLSAVQVLILLIDECSSPYNLLIIDPRLGRQFYYSDYLLTVKRLLNPPQLTPDNIHLKYQNITIPNYLLIHPLKIQIMAKYIDTVISEYNKWKFHPYKIELSILIADILMKLNRREDARHFYLFFKDSNTSEKQMAAWLQDIIARLENEFT